jgi:hypothetical protein
MASTSRDRKQDGVKFIREDDGSVTAHDIETGIARGGDTRADALAQLAEVLQLEDGGGEPIDDPDDFLRTEMNIDPDDLDEHDELPEFLQ